LQRHARIAAYLSHSVRPSRSVVESISRSRAIVLNCLPYPGKFLGKLLIYSARESDPLSFNRFAFRSLFLPLSSSNILMHAATLDTAPSSADYFLCRENSINLKTFRSFPAVKKTSSSFIDHLFLSVSFRLVICATYFST
jgi:hypothetical protein